MSEPGEDLEAWGYDRHFRGLFEAEAPEGLAPARVTVGYRALYDLASARGTVRAARVAGRYKHDHEEQGPLAFPAVGDWVAVDLDNPGTPVIHHVLPRRTAFIRKAAGRADDAQVVAANVDWVLLVSSLNEDFNPRRIERYLSMAHESGAAPVIVLNKADLGADVNTMCGQLEAVRGEAPVHAVSAKSGQGVEALGAYLRGHATVAVLGSSGVGKSTLVNRLMGEPVQKTRGIRSDGKGRHTTTNRSLFRAPSGGLLLDTPGMRELHVWEGERGIDEAFADIVELSRFCKFRDCRHQREPGCAVRRAVEEGELGAERLIAYRKLASEADALHDHGSRRSR